MAAGKIHIQLDYVRTLKGNVDDTAGRLRGGGNLKGTIDSDGRVDDALGDFMGKWDKRRGQVADTLDAVASALQAIDESFTATDDKLTSQLNGDG
ncbi:MAG: hypothetical protein QM733_06300 [Ilumatobacteraceae bacterium]